MPSDLALTKDELKNLYDSTAILDLAGGYELNGEKIKYGFSQKNLKKKAETFKNSMAELPNFSKAFSYRLYCHC